MKTKLSFLLLTLTLGLFSWTATAQVTISGATGITDGTTYTTLKGAFDAINANASGVNTDEIALKVSDNTTETATAVLNPSKGVNTLTTATGSGYQAPVITLTGGTVTTNGNVTTTITNGAITSIVMTGGAWTVAPTIAIAAPAGGGTTATATGSISSTQVVFTITNGGTGYGPKATFTGDGTGAAVDVKMTTTATAVVGAASPRTVTPATVGLTYVLTCPGSGYTSAPTCDISAVAGGTGGTVTVASLYPSIEFSKLAIYPTVVGKTISGAVGLISIVGRKNVTIDGRVNRTGTPAVGSADNLTISCTHAGNAAITLNSNAQNDTIQYCTIKGQEVTSPLGILNFGTAASLANGNGLNVIDHNLFTPSSGTVPGYAIYAQGNSAFPNVGNKITNNEFKDLIAQYVASTTLYVTGGITSPTNDNYTISGNSFYNSVALVDYASSNLQKVIIGIGGSSTTFGGSHTIAGNYIGGTAANCGGSVFTKTARETNFYGLLLYASPSVSGGGATSIQNNTIQKISWANDYYSANWLAISIGGTGAVNIGTETGNTIGDNTTTGSLSISNKSASASATIINIGTTGVVNCQNNKIGSITASNGTANFVTSINCIVKTGVAGATTISNNVIGSTTQANSINATCTGTAVQAIYGVNCTGTGINTVSNNTIANLTNNVNGVGNIYSISCAGTNSNTVSNNTSFNITNTTTTGSTYGINIGGAGSTGTANGNLVHSITVGPTTTSAIVFGIWGALGTNTFTNNIVKLGDNNSCEIRGIGDPSATTSTSAYHNTVYLTGAPTTLALNSSCIYSSGLATIRNYKNNLLVNARSNNGATGTHFALNMTANATGTIAVDGNDYVASGTGGVLGAYSGNKTSLPIVTSNDASSVSVSPSFVNAGGTVASDYKLTSATSMTGVSGTSVGFDYDGASRVGTIIGAFEMATLTTSVNTLSDLNYATGFGPSLYLNSFNVSGSAISGHITVTAPTNFEVSKTGVVSEFTPSVTIAASNGSVATIPIYVRLVGGLSANTYSGDVTVSATGVTSKTVACSGLVDATVGTKTPVSAGLRIISINGQLSIAGAKAGQLIEVYNASGSRISSTVATDGDNRLTLSAKGFQLIKVGTEVRKVMVK